MKFLVLAVAALCVATILTERCSFLRPDMTVASVKQGRIFKDGCNKCTCGEGGVAACTAMYCSYKCPVEVDGVHGWLGRQARPLHRTNSNGCVEKCTCDGWDGDLGAFELECNEVHCNANDKANSPSLPSCPYIGSDGRVAYARPGKGFSDGCNRCICGNNGLAAGCTLMLCPWKCEVEVDGVSGYLDCKEEESSPRCPYIGSDGRVAYARPGDGYSDGCNRCRCGRNGLAAGCTLMLCPWKCEVEVDGVSGYLDC